MGWKGEKVLLFLDQLERSKFVVSSWLPLGSLLSGLGLREESATLGLLLPFKAFHGEDRVRLPPFPRPEQVRARCLGRLLG
jgi:hypothetical protein